MNQDSKSEDLRVALTEMMVLFDNNEWIESKMVELGLQKLQDVPNEAFLVVRKHHPYLGCAFNAVNQFFVAFHMAVVQSPKTDVQNIAKYADAVTVLCCEALGDQVTSVDSISKHANVTAIGNLAYIAQKHSNKSIRNKATLLLQQWRNHFAFSAPGSPPPPTAEGGEGESCVCF